MTKGLVPDRPVRPFSNGSEYEYWAAHNCNRCVLNGYLHGGKECEMETALSMGTITGTIPADLAEEFGATIDKQPGFCTMPRQCKHFLLRASSSDTER